MARGRPKKTTGTAKRGRPRKIKVIKSNDDESGDEDDSLKKATKTTKKKSNIYKDVKFKSKAPILDTWICTKSEASLGSSPFDSRNIFDVSLVSLDSVDYRLCSQSQPVREPSSANALKQARVILRRVKMISDAHSRKDQVNSDVALKNKSAPAKDVNENIKELKKSPVNCKKLPEETLKEEKTECVSPLSQKESDWESDFCNGREYGPRRLSPLKIPKSRIVLPQYDDSDDDKTPEYPLPEDSLFLSRNWVSNSLANRNLFSDISSFTSQNKIPADEIKGENLREVSPVDVKEDKPKVQRIQLIPKVYSRSDKNIKCETVQKNGMDAECRQDEAIPQLSPVPKDGSLLSRSHCPSQPPTLVCIDHESIPELTNGSYHDCLVTDSDLIKKKLSYLKSCDESVSLTENNDSIKVDSMDTKLTMGEEFNSGGQPLVAQGTSSSPCRDSIESSNLTADMESAQVERHVTAVTLSQEMAPCSGSCLDSTGPSAVVPPAANSPFTAELDPTNVSCNLAEESQLNSLRFSNTCQEDDARNISLSETYIAEQNLINIISGDSVEHEKYISCVENVVWEGIETNVESVQNEMLSQESPINFSSDNLTSSNVESYEGRTHAAHCSDRCSANMVCDNDVFNRDGSSGLSHLSVNITTGDTGADTRGDTGADTWGDRRSESTVEQCSDSILPEAADYSLAALAASGERRKSLGFDADKCLTSSSHSVVHVNTALGAIPPLTRIANNEPQPMNLTRGSSCEQQKKEQKTAPTTQNMSTEKLNSSHVLPMQVHNVGPKEVVMAKEKPYPSKSPSLEDYRSGISSKLNGKIKPVNPLITSEPVLTASKVPENSSRNEQHTAVPRHEGTHDKTRNKMQVSSACSFIEKPLPENSTRWIPNDPLFEPNPNFSMYSSSSEEVLRTGMVANNYYGTGPYSVAEVQKKRSSMEGHELESQKKKVKANEYISRQHTHSDVVSSAGRGFLPEETYTNSWDKTHQNYPLPQPVSTNRDMLQVNHSKPYHGNYPAVSLQHPFFNTSVRLTSANYVNPSINPAYAGSLSSSTSGHSPCVQNMPIYSTVNGTNSHKANSQHLVHTGFNMPAMKSHGTGHQHRDTTSSVSSLHPRTSAGSFVRGVQSDSSSLLVQDPSNSQYIYEPTNPVELTAYANSGRQPLWHQHVTNTPISGPPALIRSNFHDFVSQSLPQPSSHQPTSFYQSSSMPGSKHSNYKHSRGKYVSSNEDNYLITQAVSRNVATILAQSNHKEKYPHEKVIHEQHNTTRQHHVDQGSKTSQHRNKSTLDPLINQLVANSTSVKVHQKPHPSQAALTNADLERENLLRHFYAAQLGKQKLRAEHSVEKELKYPSWVRVPETVESKQQPKTNSSVADPSNTVGQRSPGSQNITVTDPSITAVQKTSSSHLPVTDPSGTVLQKNSHSSPAVKTSCSRGWQKSSEQLARLLLTPNNTRPADSRAEGIEQVPTQDSHTEVSQQGLVSGHSVRDRRGSSSNTIEENTEPIREPLDLSNSHSKSTHNHTNETRGLTSSSPLAAGLSKDGQQSSNTPSTIERHQHHHKPLRSLQFPVPPQRRKSVNSEPATPKSAELEVSMADPAFNKSPAQSLAHSNPQAERSSIDSASTQRFYNYSTQIHSTEHVTPFSSSISPVTTSSMLGSTLYTETRNTGVKTASQVNNTPSPYLVSPVSSAHTTLPHPTRASSAGTCSEALRPVRTSSFLSNGALSPRRMTSVEPIDLTPPPRAAGLPVKDFFTSPAKENTYSSLLMAQIASKSKRPREDNTVTDELFGFIRQRNELDMVFQITNNLQRNAVIDLTDADDVVSVSSMDSYDEDRRNKLPDLTLRDKTPTLETERCSNLLSGYSDISNDNPEDFENFRHETASAGYAMYPPGGEYIYPEEIPAVQMYSQENPALLSCSTMLNSQAPEHSLGNLRVDKARKENLAEKLKAAVSFRRSRSEDAEAVPPEADGGVPHHSSEAGHQELLGERPEQSVQQAAATLLMLSSNPLYTNFMISPEASEAYQEKVYQVHPTLEKGKADESESVDLPHKTGTRTGRRVGRPPKDQPRLESEDSSRVAQASQIGHYSAEPSANVSYQTSHSTREAPPRSNVGMNKFYRQGDFPYRNTMAEHYQAGTSVETDSMYHNLNSNANHYVPPGWNQRSGNMPAPPEPGVSNTAHMQGTNPVYLPSYTATHMTPSHAGLVDGGHPSNSTFSQPELTPDSTTKVKKRRTAKSRKNVLLDETNEPQMVSSSQTVTMKKTRVPRRKQKVPENPPDSGPADNQLNGDTLTNSSMNGRVAGELVSGASEETSASPVSRGRKRKTNLTVNAEEFQANQVTDDTKHRLQKRVTKKILPKQAPDLSGRQPVLGPPHLNRSNSIIEITHEVESLSSQPVITTAHKENGLVVISLQTAEDDAPDLTLDNSAEPVNSLSPLNLNNYHQPSSNAGDSILDLSKATPNHKSHYEEQSLWASKINNLLKSPDLGKINTQKQKETKNTPEQRHAILKGERTGSVESSPLEVSVNYSVDNQSKTYPGRKRRGRKKKELTNQPSQVRDNEDKEKEVIAWLAMKGDK
ncbi:uncharacterized protein LOC131929449 isoform X2 [Physella acuta]|nr:uncharacterized protein LOC131929449 isoform X2 [Physella acuta]XP_059141644.1 uncharacterized protein LOC131929449 isoform X2 [Physella acuta]XP_059141645.1 uncharacterized protein LOC131929449 isoform X2 [Physella acuta]XP_059141646.1 uncharacterized protein LOC131929449 isoform X2 [Physella acuta]XP_059141647.1 uncharacterized protein LOC131929449 isoform X2 [Physella acuta]